MDSDQLYAEASARCGAILQRLARGYEADPERRRDLLQEMHIEIWRSFKLFNNRCSLQTWVYRVAHNVGASHILGRRRAAARLVDLETLAAEPGFVDGEQQAQQQYSVSRLFERIYLLKPLDRQIILALRQNPTRSAFQAAFLKATNSVLVAASRCALSNR